MPLQVDAHSAPELLGAEVLLQHPQHGRALLVGEDVEHRLGLAGRRHRELDRARAPETVHRQGRRARRAEGDPPLPLRLPRIDRQHLHERREGLVQPETVPPRHGHEVAERHVGDLVGDHVGDALELVVGGRLLVDQEERREVRDGEEVELVARIRHPVVPLEEVQREDRRLLAEPRQRRLAGHAPDPDRRRPDHHGVGRLQVAHDERHQVRGHDDRVGEDHALLAGDGAGKLAGHPRVRHRGQPLVDDEGDGEDGLE